MELIMGTIIIAGIPKGHGLASYFSRAMESGKKVYPIQFLLLFLFYDMFY